MVSFTIYFLLIYLIAQLSVRTFWLQSHLWLHIVISSVPHQPTPLDYITFEWYLSAYLLDNFKENVFTYSKGGHSMRKQVRRRIMLLSLRIKREVGPSFFSSRAFLRPILELSGSASAHRRHLKRRIEID